MTILSKSRQNGTPVHSAEGEWEPRSLLAGGGSLVLEFLPSPTHPHTVLLPNGLMCKEKGSHLKTAVKTLGMVLWTSNKILPS